MPSAASAAQNVTQKPQTNTGICGYWISLYVGVISSSVTRTGARARSATRLRRRRLQVRDRDVARTRPSVRPVLFLSSRLSFVRRRLSPRLSLSARTVSIRTDGHVTAQRQLSFGVGNVYGYAPCSCGRRCRYSKQPVPTVCAPDDISVTCSTLEAECDCGF